MPRILLLFGWICLCYACHDTSDHDIKGPEPDTTGNAARNRPKDTSIHNGTITSITDQLTHDLQAVKDTTDNDQAFVKLMGLHRKAVLEISQIETSEGGRSDVFAFTENLISRSHKILARLNEVPVKDTGIKKPHTLRYKIPITEVRFEKMFHTGASLDNDFLDMLITIEKSEIILANSYLKEGSHPSLRQIAKTIITDNQKEIGKLASIKID